MGSRFRKNSEVVGYRYFFALASLKRFNSSLSQAALVMVFAPAHCLDAKGIAASIRQRIGAGEPRLVVNNG